MDLLLDPFQPEFMQRALQAGLLTSVVCSLVGTWVVVRGLSFMGDALAHGVLPGLAAAFALGVDLTLGATVSAIVVIAGVSAVRRWSRLSEDTGIGLLFVGMLALGVIILSREASYAGDLTSFLFGNILAVGPDDLWVQRGVTIAVVVVAVLGHRAFLALSFHEGKAAVLGLRPGLANVALLALITAAVVSSFRSTGTLLVIGLLIAPPATATLVVRRLPAVMAVATGISALCVVAGLIISYHHDTAASATVAFLPVAVFFVVLAVRELVDRVRGLVPVSA